MSNNIIHILSEAEAEADLEDGRNFY